jgi:hypothetical protein
MASNERKPENLKSVSTGTRLGFGAPLSTVLALVEEIRTAAEADVISVLFDSEHAAQVLVTAIAEGELKNPKQWVHKSCARGRRSATNGAHPFESGTHAGPSCAGGGDFLRAPGKFHAWK